MSLFFTGHNSLLHPIIERVAENDFVQVLHNRHLPDPVIKGVEVRPINYGAFALPKIFRFLGSERSAPSYVVGLKNILSETKPDKVVILDFHKFVFWQAMSYKKKNPNCKLYLYSETKAWPQGWLAKIGMYVFWWYLKINLSYIEKVIVYTEQGKNFFEERLKSVKIELCPVPVDTDFWRPDPHKEFMPNGVMRILMNARFVSYKNHRDLLEVVRILNDRNLEVEVSFIGRGGHFKEEVKRMVEEAGLQKQIRFLETVPQEVLRNVYASHDVLVLPSYNEAIGMVVPEAMSCGVPTLTSDTVGANVYVKERETGLIFETGSIDDLAQKLEEMHSSQLLKSMSSRARAIMEASFTPEVIGEKFLNIIDTK